MEPEVQAVVENASSVNQNVSETPESIQDRNWKAHREKMEIERKEKQEAQRRANEKAAEAEALKAALEAALNKSQPKRHYESEDNDVDEEEVRIQKKIDKALEARDKQYELQRQQIEAREYPKRLNETYKDFNTVCSQENVDYLEYHHPEISEAFNHMPDGYNKWSKVYSAIKKLVPHTTDNEKKKILQNLNRPQSMAVPGITQVSDNAPQQTDDKRRAENYKRMVRVMKGG